MPGIQNFRFNICKSLYSNEEKHYVSSNWTEVLTEHRFDKTAQFNDIGTKAPKLHETENCLR